MPHSLTITIVFIVVATVVGAFIRRRKRDKCLIDFSGDLVTLEELSGKAIFGSLRVENTGLEFVYSEKHKDSDGHDETSYILYKFEYPNIQALVRYHDRLTEKAKKQRQLELKKTYHPTLWRKLGRRIVNVFRTVKDSVMEVFNLLITHAKKATPVGATLTTQDKYVSQMKQELVGSVGTSFEPLLERHIGHMVVLELTRGDNTVEYCGVLKDYTAEFVEVMDIDYRVKPDEPARKADLVVLRKYGIIRHHGE